MKKSTPKKSPHIDIIATLGPASSDPAHIAALIRAGMTVARLNFSHGTYADFARIITDIRSIARKQNKKIKILQDLQGLKTRLGTLTETIPLHVRQHLTLSTEARPHAGEIPVQYPRFADDVTVGQRILVSDGMVELVVLKISGKHVEVRVEHGRELRSHAGVNLPGARAHAKRITPKDTHDLIFGAEHGVDMVALSFVQTGQDMQDLRKLLTKHGSKANTVAKIECATALEDKNLSSIIAASDAVMVARGDMGVEMGLVKVPFYQKKIIKIANEQNTPAIVATQMLTSMLGSTTPTRAEVSDIANAILDGASAVMLSDETAIGKYPVEAVRWLRLAAEEAGKLR